MTRRGALLFGAMGGIWGIPYLLIKVAVRHVTPATLVLGRTAVGAAILLPIAASRGELRPVLRVWRPLVAYTVAELCIPWLLLSTAEERLPSSVSGLLVAAVPMIGAVLSRLFVGHQPLGRRGLAGLLVGLVGVGALVGFDVAGADLGSAAMVAVVAVGYAAGPLILSRKLGHLPGLGVVAASLGLCALVYAPFGLTELPSHAPPARAIAAIVVLGVVCTALAFVLFFELIAEVGPVRATVITYINPAVAVVLGVAFLSESFGLGAAAGCVLILGGCVLATARYAGDNATLTAGADASMRSTGDPGADTTDPPRTTTR